MISNLFNWAINAIGGFFNRIIDIITTVIDAFFALVAGLLHFIYMIGVLAVKLFQLFFSLGSILVSLVVGFARTLQSLTFTPNSSSGHGYSDVIIRIFDNLTHFDLAPIGIILSFVIWFTTAIFAIRLISSIRNQ